VCCGGCGSDSGVLLTVGVFGVDLAVLCGLGVVQVSVELLHLRGGVGGFRSELLVCCMGVVVVFGGGGSEAVGVVR
jgi:hypothetical protein